MCGIAGVFWYRSTGTVSAEILAHMRDAMQHRGPDGGDCWISGDTKVGLAHRRLSIIDLSNTAAQPMCNENGSVWVTFNGEIWNHLSLRAELKALGHKFKTDHSDTEVIVHGYEQWGLDGLLTRLDGDFGFGLWDESARTLSLARDRVGVKPLYFSEQGGALRFASEIKGILADPNVERDVDPLAMYHYLSFLTTPAPLTMFKGIYKLPAGYYLQVKDGGESKSCRYWDALPGQGIPSAETAGLSESEREEFYITGIRDRLSGAVEKRMMSDVPFGVFLSGGVDSSTNVALMSQYVDKPLDTFTVGFKDYEHLNELDHAEAVAKRYNTNHHVVLVDEQDMVGYLDDLIHHQDEPLADWVCIPLYFVSKLARDNGAEVIQVGEGSDEQFCGYASYMGYLKLYEKYWSPFRQWLPKSAQRATAGLALAAARRRSSLGVYADIVNRAAEDREHFWSGATVFWDFLKDQLVNQGSISARSMAQSVVDEKMLPAGYLQPDTFNVIKSFQDRIRDREPSADVLTRMIYNEFKLRLPELLLMRVDKISMSVALEARVPFLDHRLVEFTMDIPMQYKVRNGETKYLLKKAVEDLLPHEIIYRKKMGFGAPMSDWLRGDFGRHAETKILGSKLMARGYFDLNYIGRLTHEHRSGKADNSLYIWTLFNLTSWFDYWIDGEAKPH